MGQAHQCWQQARDEIGNGGAGLLGIEAPQVVALNHVDGAAGFLCKVLRLEGNILAKQDNGRKKAP